MSTCSGLWDGVVVVSAVWVCRQVTPALRGEVGVSAKLTLAEVVGVLWGWLHVMLVFK